MEKTFKLIFLIVFTNCLHFYLSNTINTEIKKSNEFNLFSLAELKTESCKENSDCLKNNSCVVNKCKHNSLFPLNFIKVIEIIIMAIVSSIAVSCGLGGGGIYSTLLMTLENFEPSEAFPISVFISLFATLSVYLLGANMKVNFPQHKFVNYDLVNIASPMILLGTKVGVNLNLFLPSLFLHISLFLFLLDGTRKIYNQYSNLKDKENLESDKNTLSLKQMLSINSIFNIGKRKLKDKSSISSNRKLSASKYVQKDTIIEEISEKDTHYSPRKLSDEINFRKTNPYDIIELSNSSNKPSDDSIKTVKDNIKFVVSEDISNNKKVNELEIIFSNIEDGQISRTSVICRYNSPIVKTLMDQIKKLDLVKINYFEEKQSIKLAKIRILIELIALLFTYELFVGTSKFHSIIKLEHCSIIHTIFFLVFIFLCYRITYLIHDGIRNEEKLSDLFTRTLVKEIRHQNKLNVAKFTNSQINKIIFSGFLCGVFSGMLGLGGGMFLTKLFIQLEIDPKVTNSTSNFLIVFSSACVSIQFFFANQLTIDYAFILGVIIMMSSIVGFKIINDTIVESGKRADIMYYLYLCMLLCVFCLPFAVYRKIIHSLLINETIFKFTKLC